MAACAGGSPQAEVLQKGACSVNAMSAMGAGAADAARPGGRRVAIILDAPGDDTGDQQGGHQGGSGPGPGPKARGATRPPAPAAATAPAGETFQPYPPEVADHIRDI